MNILFFARRFYPEIGGVETHVLELSKQLLAKGHKVTVISELHAKLHTSSFEKQTGITLLKIPVAKKEKGKKFLIWQWLWKNKTVIEKADIVHCHDVFFWYLPFRFLFPKKPVFTTFHGYESYPIAKKAIVVRKISEKLSWGNICIGDFINKWYGTKADFISYGAVDLTRFQNNMKNVKQQSALFVGRLDEQTGILTYTKAFEMLKKKFPKFLFATVGDGKYKKQIQKKVRVLGFQNNPEKYFQHYRFAFVSRYLSLLEAFATKRLVFAVYDNPVKEDYLKMSPFAKFIIIEKTAEDIAKKVEMILQNPEKEKKMIAAAFSWVQKQSWEEMGSLYIRLWKKQK